MQKDEVDMLAVGDFTIELAVLVDPVEGTLFAGEVLLSCPHHWALDPSVVGRGWQVGAGQP